MLSRHIVVPPWEHTSMFFPYFSVKFLGWPHTSGDLLPPALAPGQCLSCLAQGTRMVVYWSFSSAAALGHSAGILQPGQMSLEARISRFCDSSGAEAGSAIPEHMVQALAVVAVRLLYRLVLSIDC